MTNPASSVPSFLRDAFESHAPYSSAHKQEAQKCALRWLQLHIDTDLEDKTIIEQFTQKWRVGSNKPPLSDRSPLSLDTIPRSYNKNSIDNHQEEALVFLQEVVPLQMQEEFQQRWDAPTRLEITNSSGTSLKIAQREMTLLQQEDPDGNGIAWYHVEHRKVFYLLSSEPKDDDFLVVLSEEISPQNCNTWFVAQEDVRIANV